MEQKVSADAIFVATNNFAHMPLSQAMLLNGQYLREGQPGCAFQEGQSGPST